VLALALDPDPDPPPSKKKNWPGRSQTALNLAAIFMSGSTMLAINTIIGQINWQYECN